MKISSASSRARLAGRPGVPEIPVPARRRREFQGIQRQPFRPVFDRSERCRCFMHVRDPPVGQRGTPERSEDLVGTALPGASLPGFEQQRAVETFGAGTLLPQCLLDGGITVFDGRLVATIPEHGFGIAGRDQGLQCLQTSGRGTGATATLACAGRHRARPENAVAMRSMPHPVSTRPPPPAHARRRRSAHSPRRAQPAVPGCRRDADRCGTRPVRWAWPSIRASRGGGVRLRRNARAG